MAHKPGCIPPYIAFNMASSKNDVLKANTYNGNILGRYFARDMENCKC